MPSARRSRAARSPTATSIALTAHVDLRRSVAAVLRRIPRHRHRRRDDPRPAVRASCSNSASSWSRPRTSRRTISTRTASTARCSCRSSRRSRRTWRCCGSTRAPISGMEKLAGVKIWLVPAGRDGRAPRSTRPGAADRHAQPAPRDIAIKGRMLHVPLHGARRRAVFVRRSVREAAWRVRLSAARARLSHAVIDRIPVMDYADRNAAKRFITLIDTLYDNAREADGLGRGRSAVAVPGDRRLRGDGIPAHRLAADRDALGELPGAAARPRAIPRRAASSTGLVET